MQEKQLFTSSLFCVHVGSIYLLQGKQQYIENDDIATATSIDSDFFLINQEERWYVAKKRDHNSIFWPLPPQKKHTKKRRTPTTTVGSPELFC